ncbi:MAP kinase-interacting serine/threonine-protein kinase 2 [Gossypium arboreum]|uniref:MAP kinase-interacting serine/threonine-protein kinase 2 n=1 Tax=Gossypium arboreum TaxID=29729 RepID=A0A0B0N1C9_GOSAR|nr:MAP kinase-interacting serine/threonine-protein kinase 2 [Gossypium arboreum]
MEVLTGLLIQASSQSVTTRATHTCCQVSDPLKDYLATSRTHKSIAQNPITCIGSLMNSDQLNELECHIYHKPDQLNESGFLNS